MKSRRSGEPGSSRVRPGLLEKVQYCLRHYIGQPNWDCRSHPHLTPTCPPLLSFHGTSHEKRDHQQPENEYQRQSKDPTRAYGSTPSTTPFASACWDIPPVFPAQRLLSILSAVPEGEGESGVDDMMVDHLVYTPRAIHAETVRTTDWENVDSAKRFFRLVIPAELLRRIDQVGDII